MDLAQFLTERFPGRLNVEKPIDPELFKLIPFFNETFDENCLPLLTKLSNSSGIAYIERKIYKPKDTVIKQGQHDMTIFWLLKGRTDVIISRKGHNLLLAKKYDEVGSCFGENAIIDPRERTAFVYAGKNEGCEVLKIDWSITEVCFELKANFNEILLKTINLKLIDTYNQLNKAHQSVEIMKNVNKKLLSENY